MVAVNYAGGEYVARLERVCARLTIDNGALQEEVMRLRQLLADQEAAVQESPGDGAPPTPISAAASSDQPSSAQRTRQAGRHPESAESS